MIKPILTEKANLSLSKGAKFMNQNSKLCRLFCTIQRSTPIFTTLGRRLKKGIGWSESYSIVDHISCYLKFDSFLTVRN